MALIFGISGPGGDTLCLCGKQLYIYIFLLDNEVTGWTRNQMNVQADRRTGANLYAPPPTSRRVGHTKLNQNICFGNTCSVFLLIFFLQKWSCTNTSACYKMYFIIEITLETEPS